jgi:CheY-like chemotaxis protein
MPKNLLVADDSLTIRKVIGMVLALEDFQMTSVDNGIDAISRARDLKPDLVLADVLMPGRSGYEVCEALKSDPSTSHIPVMLLAGNFEPFDEARARAARADDHITKPFESQAFLDKVRKLLGLPLGQPMLAPRPALASAATPQSAVPRPSQPMAAIPQGAPRPTSPTGATPIAPRPAQPMGVPQPMPGPAGIPRPAGSPTPMAGMPRPYAPAATQPGQSRSPTAPTATQPGLSRSPIAPTATQPGLSRSPTAPGMAAGAASRPATMPSQGLPRPPVAMPASGTGRTAAPPSGMPLVTQSGFARPAAPMTPAGFPRAPGAAPLPPMTPAAPGPSSARGRDPFGLSAPVSTPVRGYHVEPQIPAPTGAEEMSLDLGTEPVHARDGGEAQLREALGKASREVIEKIAWEVVPQLAETIVREIAERTMREREGKG